MYAWCSEGVGSRGRDPVAVAAVLPPSSVLTGLLMRPFSVCPPGLLQVLSTDENTVVLYTERAEAPCGHPAGSQ